MASKGMHKDENGDKYGSNKKMNFMAGSLRRNKNKKNPSFSGSPPGSPDAVATSPRSPAMNIIVQQSFDLASAIGADDQISDKSSDKSSLSEHTSNTTKRDNYVGFANLPNQVFRKSVKKGFQFTLMVVGESGLGKSTLINSLFLTDLYVNTAYEDAASKFGKTMTTVLRTAFALLSLQLGLTMKEEKFDDIDKNHFDMV